MRILLALLFLTCVALPGMAADWTRFRGPNGTGIATDANVPMQWDEKNILWKTTIPGAGNSSPIITGDKLFIQSASKDQLQRSLYCIDTKSGKVLWTYSAAGTKVKTHPKNTVASATPATDGKAVYANFWDGDAVTLVACDFEGKELWKQPLGPFQSRHGAGFSPILVNDLVVVLVDQDNTSVVRAFKAKTGEPVWETSRKASEDCSYSTPFIWEREKQKPELIVATTTGIAGYSPTDGKELWQWKMRFPGGPLRMVASPIAVDDLIFVTTGNGGGSRASAVLRPTGTGDISSVTPVWEKRKVVPYVPTMVVADGHLYGINDIGQAICIDAKTGEEVFVERLGGAFTASPILVNGQVVSVNEEGVVYVFAAKQTFELIAKNPLNDRVYASPAVANGKLFIRGQSTLYCIGKK